MDDGRAMHIGRKMQIIIRKYKFILVPLLMVLVFDLSLLLMNFHISAQLEVSANNINIAGRQRMLSQKIAKSVALIKIHSQYDSTRYRDDRQELLAAVNLFNQTLNAFTNGGSAISASGDIITVEKLVNTEAASILHYAKTLWAPLHSELNKLVTADHYTDHDLTKLVDALTDKNIELLSLMNDLTNYLENDAKQKTYFLRGLQTIVICLVLLSFIVASIRLYRREMYYDNLMEKTTDVVISIDVKTARTTFVSSSVTDLLGNSTSDYLGKPASLFFAKESKIVLSQIIEHIELTGELEQPRCEIKLQKHDGSIVIADMVMQILISEDGHSKELGADIRDISERKQAEVALAELAHKDILTGLANRSLFYELVAHSLSMAKRDNKKLAIMFIDLDDFKAINDNFGHGVGDVVLTAVAERITSCLRESDSACRMGGDEFVVLLENIDKREEIEVLANKIVNAISEVIVVGDRNCYVGASVGIALYPEHGLDIETLMKKADNAMYHVKSTGKQAVSFV